MIVPRPVGRQNYIAPAHHALFAVDGGKAAGTFQQKAARRRGMTMDRRLFPRVVERIGRQDRIRHIGLRAQAGIRAQQRPSFGALKRNRVGRPVKPWRDLIPFPDMRMDPWPRFRRLDIATNIPERDHIQRRSFLRQTCLIFDCGLISGCHFRSSRR